MQIKFTKDEMEKLVELMTIADWVLTSQDVEDDERKDAYLKLLQKIYGEAYKNGMTKEITEENGEYFPDEEWEENAQARDFIEEYEDATFWDELVYRLSDRDIDRKLNGKAPKSFEEHVAMFTKVQQKYEEEFEKNNLENLEVVAPKKAEKPAKAVIKKVSKPAAKTTAKPAAKAVKKSAKK